MGNRCLFVFGVETAFWIWESLENYSLIRSGVGSKLGLDATFDNSAVKPGTVWVPLVWTGDIQKGETFEFLVDWDRRVLVRERFSWHSAYLSIQADVCSQTHDLIRRGSSPKERTSCAKAADHWLPLSEGTLVVARQAFFTISIRSGIHLRLVLADWIEKIILYLIAVLNVSGWLI